MPPATYDLKTFEARKAALFTDVESLPSLACRRRCVLSLPPSRALPAHFFFFYAASPNVIHYISNPPRASPSFLDAMMVQRELKKGESEFAKRVLPEDQARLVRDRLFLLKICVVNKKDSDEPYLYSLH